MAKTPIAVEISASSFDLRAWVAVYPRLERRADKITVFVTGYLVKRFEYKRGMEDSYDTDYYISNVEKRLLNSIAEVEQELEEWGVDAALMVPPWRCDYPL